MKAVFFLHVSYLIFIKSFMVKGTTKCGTQVELRAVLLSCPARDNGCEDSDLLSQTMDAEQEQMLRATGRNLKVLKETRTNKFPNAVKDCKRKLVITMRVKNVGKVPCDDKYIVVDHVYDPVTGGKGRLLSPVVLKLRQEQMVQLYGLKFQKVVNNDPYEEQISGKKVCSVNPNNPTCGIAMYDGKPIPFSEGFCCSCSSHINAKRQLSPTSRGDSFIYRDSKLISQGHSHLTREIERPPITDPHLVQLRSKAPEYTKKEQEYLNRLNSDKIPNYLLEKDRKIICDRGDFMNELCNLRDEKMKFGAEGENTSESGRDTYTGEKAKNVEKDKSKKGKTERAIETTQASAQKKSKSEFILNDGMEMLNLEAKPVLGSNCIGSRGKRENRYEMEGNTLEESLEKFLRAKKLYKNRRKRLLEISHRRNRKKEIRCTPAGCDVAVGAEFPDKEYVKPQPPMYFFSHDKVILNPLEATKSNDTNRTPMESAYQGLKYALEKNKADSKWDKNGRKGCHQKSKTKCLKDQIYTVEEDLLGGDDKALKHPLSDQKINTDNENRFQLQQENQVRDKEPLVQGQGNIEDNYDQNEKMRTDVKPNFRHYILSKTNEFLRSNKQSENTDDEDDRKNPLKAFNEVSKQMKEDNSENGYEYPFKPLNKMDNFKIETENSDNTLLKMTDFEQKSKQEHKERKYIPIPKERYSNHPIWEKGDDQAYDFNMEITHQEFPMAIKPRYRPQNQNGFLLNRPEMPAMYFKPKQNRFYNKIPTYGYFDQNQPMMPQDVYIIRTENGPLEVRNPHYYFKEPRRVPIDPERSRFINYYRKPPFFEPYPQFAENPDLRPRSFQSNHDRYRKDNVEYSRKPDHAQEHPEESMHEKIRSRRSVEFEPAKGYFASDSKTGGNLTPHEFETCPVETLQKSQEIKEIDINSEILSRLPKLKEKLAKHDGKAERSPKTDMERLIQSYLTAPDYVLKQLESVKDGSLREDQYQNRNFNCGKSLEGEYTQDTAHCMRYGDLWYNVYNIRKPVVAQIVGLQLFDKQVLHDGKTRWKDITKGKMIRLGTFLTSAEDDLPSVSLTYAGEEADTLYSPIDPEKYVLLVPSHLSDPSKANLYPQLEGGPGEYLLINKKDLTFDGECNKAGTSFEAFARQPGRCGLSTGSCLKHQPIDLWREDMEARIRGKRGKYFVENFGTVPNSHIKSYTNMTGEYLAMEYYGDYTSTIEIEVKADHNLIVRKGRSSAQIPTVYVDGSYPKNTKIVMSVLNTGLTSSSFRPRLGDCSPDLDPSWCPLEGPSVTIPPQKRHDFKLDLSGPLPPNKLHATVQVLNQDNQAVAQRKIRMKRGERCMCAFHCKCNCVGDLDQGRVCNKMSEDDYRAAGYMGLPPFRAGPFIPKGFFANLRLVFFTSSYILLMFGTMKGVLGAYFRPIGIAGVRIITGPRKLFKYYEPEIECCTVLHDDFGFPIHPTTCAPVQIVPLVCEIIINVFFFFLYPLRGFWLILKNSICLKVTFDDNECSPHDRDVDQKSSSPLLSQQNTCINYNLTTITSKKCHADEFLPYLPYRGDNDPLEEDDTEFVLQEMERHKQK